MRYGETTTYAYDDAERLTAVTPPSPAPVVSYTWDDNSNLTARGSDSFTWDYEDRMVEATVNSVTTTFAYRGDGLRESRTTGMTTTTFTWDINAGLPVVLDDGAQYVYGAGLEAMLTGSGTHYYLADGLGSTMAMIDSTGAVQKSYTYDVYGKPTATGALPNEFDFAGQQTDPTGLQYLRARYMDPETGTFVSREPLAAVPGWTGSSFTYVQASPVRFIDPSGLVLVDGGEAGGGGKAPGATGGGGSGGSTWWKPWTWGRSGTRTVGEYPTVPVNNPGKLEHIFQVKHNWDSTGLSRNGNIALMEQVAKNPGNKVASQRLPNGGWKEVFEAVYHGKVIHVETYVPPAGGVPIIENGWVVVP